MSPGGDGSLVYVRPHDLEITKDRNGKPAWSARINRLTRLGGLVRLELKIGDGTPLTVQMTREQCLELGLDEGDEVYVTPKDLKFFTKAQEVAGDYVI